MKRLLLLGGGHSHVEVLRRFRTAPPPDAVVVLVSSERQTVYSGMLPGYVAGHYGYADCHIELEPLCRAAGVEFRCLHAEGIDTATREVRCSDGRMLGYDVLSINTGAVPESISIRGALAHGVRVRPLNRFVNAWASLLEHARKATGAMRLAVIGGGAGGVELVLAMQHRLQRERRSAALHLLTGESTILPDHAPGVRRRLQRALDERGVHVHVGSRVTAIDAGALEREHGARLSIDHAVLATHASAPRWLSGAGLRTDAGGFVLVNAALQSMSHPEIFAAGDVASMAGRALPKSGVYAVRQGPPLAENLRRALASRPLVAYTPQSSTLALISTGDRYAVASWRNVAFEGRWVWRWKDRIDRRFVAKYRVDAAR